MLTKNLQLLKSTVIVSEVLQLLWEYVLYNTWTKKDENSDGGDDDGAEEADDDGSAVKQSR